MVATTRKRLSACTVLLVAAAGLVLLGPATTARAAVIPILDYSFDIGTTTGGPGTTVDDLSPAGNDGVVMSGTLPQQTGMFGNSLYFSGGRHVLVGSTGSPTALLSTTDASQPYAISMWMNSESGGGLVTQYSGAGDPYRFGSDTRSSAGGKAQWWSGGATRAIGTDDLNDGSWHHVVLVKDASQNLKIYVDGQDQTAAGTNQHTTPFENTGTNIGTYNGTQLAMTGRLDEVRVFDQALDASQIYNLYSNNTVDAPKYPTLRVDLGDSSALTGIQPVQDGWRGFSSVDEETAGGVVQDLDFGVGKFTMTLSGPTDAPNWNNRGGSMEHPLSDVLVDFSYNNQYEPYNLEFDTLPAGRYCLRSYHHDRTTNYGTIARVSVTDALGTDRTIAEDVPITTGTNIGDISTVPILFESDGANPVVITYTPNSSGSYRFTHTNGFELSSVLPRELFIDIQYDSGSASLDTQEGYQAWSHPLADVTAAAEQELWFFSHAGNQGSVGVMVARDAGGFSFRDRGDVNHPMGDLAEDFVASSDDLSLILTDLQEGLYQITTYHHDRNVQHGLLSIDLVDAMGTHTGIVTGLAQTTGADPFSIASATFVFRSNGVDPVEITLRGSGSVILNGFTLLAVPEPSSLALAALGLLGLGFVGRRGRKRK